MGRLLLFGMEMLCLGVCHNSAHYVKQGQPVKQGQRIAAVGKTGRATGPNLHFEIRRHNKAQDPLKLLPPNRQIVSR